VYSPTSPLGAALLDKKVGDTVSYEAPNGSTITVEVVAPSRSDGSRDARQMTAWPISSSRRVTSAR
ncbi:MAG: GreA/GreB family elongation factor, partial [Aeromicrobium sp.]